MCFTRITLLFSVIVNLNNHGGHTTSLIVLLLRVCFPGLRIVEDDQRKNCQIQDRNASASASGNQQDTITDGTYRQ